MQLDWTISVGNVLTAAVLLAGLAAAHVQNVRRLQAIETKLEMIYEWWVKYIERGAP